MLPPLHSLETRVGVGEHYAGLRSCSSSTRLQLIVVLSCWVDFFYGRVHRHTARGHVHRNMAPHN